MRRLVLAAVLLCSAPAAGATEDCAALDTSQAGLNECFDQVYQAADKELNAIYRTVTKRLADEPEKAKLLTASQRAWIGFRDAECAFTASGVEGGSAYLVVVSQCLEDVAGKRIDNLKGYLNCGEGDLSCPVPAAK